jgi:hypothetical protein
VAKVILKYYKDVTLTEVTLSSDQGIVSPNYFVQASNPAETRTFGDMASAVTYFEELVERRKQAASEEAWKPDDPS